MTDQTTWIKINTSDFFGFGTNGNQTPDTLAVANVSEFYSILASGADALPTGLVIRSGNRIDAMQMEYDNVLAPLRLGGKGGSNSAVIDVTPGNILSIEFWGSTKNPDRLGQIVVVTKDGSTTYGSSPDISLGKLVIPSNERIVGLWGYPGGELNGVGFFTQTARQSIPINIYVCETDDPTSVNGDWTPAGETNYYYMVCGGQSSAGEVYAIPSTPPTIAEGLLGGYENRGGGDVLAMQPVNDELVFTLATVSATTAPTVTEQIFVSKVDLSVMDLPSTQNTPIVFNESNIKYEYSLVISTQGVDEPLFTIDPRLYNHQ